MLAEVPPLLSESDLHIAQQTLHLLTSVARKQRTSLLTGGVSNAILTEVLNLLRSPLLQGGALSTLLEFLQALVEFNASGRFPTVLYLIGNGRCVVNCRYISRFWVRLP